ncbi:MAG: hypothetical protein EOO61_21335 [Hymenobacter sp.]|nr:MAG: hypothetical protein EOO61_21335 [Hymenobacter sp.]
MKIWIINWHTESGDEGVLGYFDQKPTKEQIEAYFFNTHPDEYPMEDPDDENTRTCLIFWDVVELDKVDQSEFLSHRIPEQTVIEHI